MTGCQRIGQCSVKLQAVNPTDRRRVEDVAVVGHEAKVPRALACRQDSGTKVGLWHEVRRVAQKLRVAWCEAAVCLHAAAYARRRGWSARDSGCTSERTGLVDTEAGVVIECAPKVVRHVGHVNQEAPLIHTHGHDGMRHRRDWARRET
jgi:hypothetical protein